MQVNLLNKYIQRFKLLLCNNTVWVIKTNTLTTNRQKVFAGKPDPMPQ